MERWEDEIFMEMLSLFVRWLPTKSRISFLHKPAKRGGLGADIGCGARRLLFENSMLQWIPLVNKYRV